MAAYKRIVILTGAGLSAESGIATFRDKLGVDTLLLGWGLDDDNTHSPNEKFHLADYHRGIKASAYLWKERARG